MDTIRAKIEAWAAKLTAEEAREALVTLVDHSLDTDGDIDMHLVPFWESNGEPLVPGQKVWEE